MADKDGDKDGGENEPDAGERRALAEELIQDQNIITLATSSDGEAWAAPVYYVYHKSEFCFFSDPKSRHILEALASGQAAAAIHVPSFDWREIRGLQMSGRLEPVAGKMAALGAVRAYLAKFPFTKDFFTADMTLDMAAIESRFRVKLYRFTPNLSYYLDNKIRFGYREEVNFN